jgi:hypothetical protein
VINGLLVSPGSETKASLRDDDDEGGTVGEVMPRGLVDVRPT